MLSLRSDQFLEPFSLIPIKKQTCINNSRYLPKLKAYTYSPSYLKAEHSKAYELFIQTFDAFDVPR